ncbi:MAG TPA: WD40 repeat domain-containing protein [Ktedonobacterales bacterium]|nr:WD40 repeat domain-containing protein [Ktedonobacterales bacterium]
MQSGGETIAFLRGKTLFAVSRDGSNLRVLGQGNIAGIAWSPDHHQIVYRVSRSPVIASPLSLLGAPDAPGELVVTSVNGPSDAVQISPPRAELSRSDAWWNANGNRLLYRESPNGATDSATSTPIYIVSQADQPVGIAREPVVDNAGLPVLSPDGSRLATFDSNGTIWLGAPSSAGKIVAKGALLTLSGASRLARLLWQPQHNALLFEIVGDNGAVALRLFTIGGKVRTLGAVRGLLDLAFSPDGSRLLLRTAHEFVIWNVAKPGTSVFSWPENDLVALPWWSPDGGRILIQDSGGWQLVDIAERSVRPLVTFPGAVPTDISGVKNWRPATGSPWNSAGDRFVFVGSNRANWQGKALPMPHEGTTGLYVADPSSGGTPTLLDSGDDRAPTWSYLDPSTVFLVAA